MENQELSNESIDKIIEGIKADDTKSDGRKYRLIETYNEMRPVTEKGKSAESVDSPETAKSKIEAWSKGKSATSKTNSVIEAWSKSYQK